MAEKKEVIISRNPWLDKEYKQGLPLFTREPGLEIDDLPEKLGLLDEVTVKSSIEATKFIELADTPSDYGLDKQFPMSDGEGEITWAYPFWKPSGSSIYFRKRVAVGHSHPMVEFHVYKPQIKVQVRIGAKENPWVEWHSTDEANGFAAGIDDAANKLFKINYDSPIGTASQLFLCMDAGNTRIGAYTASPQVPYHIKESACVSVTYHPDAILAVESTTNAMIQVSAGTDAGIVFCDDDSNPPAGAVIYDHANEQMEFISATNERMWLSSAGILRTHGDYIHNDSTASSSFRADAHDADAYLDLREDNVTKWTIGFDYSDSLALVVSEGTPGSSVKIRVVPTTGNLQLINANQFIQFTGVVGGTGGIQYLDSGSTNRFGLMFPGSNIVALVNRAANGTVQLRANTSTAGLAGEVTVVTIEDDNVTFGQTFTGITGSTIGNLTLADGSIIDSGGSISFGDENLSTTGVLGIGGAVSNNVQIYATGSFDVGANDAWGVHCNTTLTPGNTKAAYAFGSNPTVNAPSGESVSGAGLAVYDVSKTGTGTIANVYGLYIRALTATATNKYGIYVAPSVNNYLAGNLTFGATSSIIFTGNLSLISSADVVALQNTQTNERAVLRVMPKGTVATIPAALEFFGTDYIADSTNYERLSIYAGSSYDISTAKGGTGTLRPLILYTAGNTNQLYLDTSGNIGLSQSTFGTNATKTVALGTGVAPTTSPADCFQMYSADIGAAAGKAGAHFRDEEGNIVSIGSGGVLMSGTARVKKLKDITAYLQHGGTAPTHFEIGDYCAWKYGIGDDSKFSTEIPHECDTSEDIEVHVKWGVDEAYATNSAEVNWQLDWSACPHDGTEAADAPTHTGSDTSGDVNIPATAKAPIHTTVETIPAASIEDHDILGIKLSRVALVGGNNPAQEPFIITAHLEYTVNKLGEAT